VQELCQAACKHVVSVHCMGYVLPVWSMPASKSANIHLGNILKYKISLLVIGLSEDQPIQLVGL
jgi:hypothetical protein